MVFNKNNNQYKMNRSPDPVWNGAPKDIYLKTVLSVLHELYL